MWCLQLVCTVLLFSFGLSSNTKPNIIVIVADDMVSYILFVLV